MDEEFRRRLESTVKTVQRWDADPQLLRHCRDRLFAPSMRSHLGIDAGIISDRDFMQHFVRYFKDHIMIWCNKPSCTACGQNGDNMEGVGSRGPISLAERHGDASRVEVYRCTTCYVETTFPRYNNVQTLYEISCQGDAKTPGRCGEYANLFGFYCRALGLETRYILDWTDHVWVEVLIRLSTDDTEQWCMIDSCEGVLHEYSMYERGWGKTLNFIVAISTTSVTDVTCKYTRKFWEPAFQQRRRAITTSEDNSRRIIQQVNQTIQSSLPVKEAKLIQDRWQREDRQLQKLSKLSSWAAEEQYHLGRLSGSLQWKALRNETGTTDSSTANGSTLSNAVQLPQWHYVGTPYNTSYDRSSGRDFEIYLRPPPAHLSDHEYWHDMIQVNQLPCAIGFRNALSVVVVDETFDGGMGGCILQSGSFTTVQDFLHFVSSVPSQRILILVGSIPTESKEDWITSVERDQLTLELGEHFCAEHIPSGILYIGQVLISAQPSWSICRSYDAAPNGINVSTAKRAVEANDEEKSTETKLRTTELQLCTFPNVRPRKICGRVPDTIMPLSIQCKAGYEAKRTAFLSYVAANPRVPCFGYTTKSGLPIYLLGRNSYPLIESRDSHDELNSHDECWNTFLWLPSILVPEDDHGIADCVMENSEISLGLPQYEVPLDQSFFQNELGEQLVFGGKSLLPTVDALHNARLVAYYFSAHWCGPCRSFTPILAELYSILKEAYPSHGLEIVFVSSDRDDQNFLQYFNTMPWFALPFDDTLPQFKQMLSAKYNVKGIPSLVVLDAISGQIVVPNTESLALVMQTVQCGAGNDMVDKFATVWLDRLPTESKDILALLATSCRFESANGPHQDMITSSPKVTQFLVRSTYAKKQLRVTNLTTQLVDEEGMDPDQAKEAAIAVEALAGESDLERCSASRLNEYFLSKVSDLSFDDEMVRSPSDIARRISNISIEQMKLVLITVWKYFFKCHESPWSPKYRQFQLSFKVADRITMVSGGVDLLEALGFQILCSDFDFVAYVPVSMNLDETKESIQNLSAHFGVCT